MASNQDPDSEQQQSLLKDPLSIGGTLSTSTTVQNFDSRPSTITQDTLPLLADSDISSVKSKHGHWIRVWGFELAAIVVSIGSLLASMAILFTYDGQPLSQWKAWLKPNTVVAALNTASTTTMLMVVGAGLSQLKWVYFRQQPHALVDLQIFDEASRGPLGSFQLIYRIHWRAVMACVGALLTVLTLATDSFVQQVLEYPQRQINATGVFATIARSSAYDTMYGSDASMAAPEVLAMFGPGMREAHYGYLTNSRHDDTMLAAIAQGVIEEGVPINFNCVSGNCTWPPFQSLGVCSTCEEVTTKVKSNCTDWVSIQALNPTSIQELNLTSIQALNLQGQGPEYVRTCQHVTPSNFTITSTNLCGDNVYGVSKLEEGLYGTLWNSSVRTSSTQRAAYIYYDALDDHTTLSKDGEIATIAAIQVPDWQSIPPEECIASPQRPNSTYECTLNWCVKSYNHSRVTNGSVFDAPSETKPLTFMDWSSCNGTRLSPWTTFVTTQGPYNSFSGGLVDVNIATITNIIPAFMEPNIPDIDCNTLTFEDAFANEACTYGDFSKCNNTKLGDELRAAHGAYLLNALNSMDLGTYVEGMLTASFQRGDLAWLEENDLWTLIGKVTGDVTPPDVVLTASDSLAESLYISQRAGQLPEMMDKIATSITNHIRNGPNSTKVNGTVHLMETHFVVHWAWMAFPASLVAITTVFFIICIVFAQERNGPIWKGSIMPLLFHGLRGWDDADLDIRDAKAMEKRSGRMLAQLKEDKLGYLWLMRGDQIVDEKAPSL